MILSKLQRKCIAKTDLTGVSFFSKARKTMSNGRNVQLLHLFYTNEAVGMEDFYYVCQQNKLLNNETNTFLPVDNSICYVCLLHRTTSAPDGGGWAS